MGAARSDSLFERDDERSTLAAAAEEARREGRLVVVEGPAGIGKTRLLRWTRDHAERGARVLTARGTELETHYAMSGSAKLTGNRTRGTFTAKLFTGETISGMFRCG